MLNNINLTLICKNILTFLLSNSINAKSKLDIGPFENIISDFYLTNPIARSSEVMAELSSIAKSKDMKVAAE